jgi:tryptophan synthase beta subunit
MGAVVAIAAAQRIKQENELIDFLRKQNALSASAATELRPQRRVGQVVLEKLLKERAVLETGAGRYWLDEAAYAAMQSQRRRLGVRMSLFMLVGLLAVVAVALMLTPK